MHLKAELLLIFGVQSVGKIAVDCPVNLDCYREGVCVIIAAVITVFVFIAAIHFAQIRRVKPVVYLEDLVIEFGVLINLFIVGDDIVIGVGIGINKVAVRRIGFT